VFLCVSSGGGGYTHTRYFSDGKVYNIYCLGVTVLCAGSPNAFESGVI